MKLYFNIVFLIAYLHGYTQEIPTAGKYNSIVVDLTRSGSFVCFPLYVQKNDGSVFRALTSSYGLFPCYYNTNDYPPEFADTVDNILNREFLGLKLEKCPTLKERAINNILYKRLGKQDIEKTIKKYFNTVVHHDDSKTFRVKKKYLSDKGMLTILCFMCDNYYIISSDNDGYYTATYWSR